MKSLKRTVLWITLLALILAGGGGCTPEGESQTPTEEVGVSFSTPLSATGPSSTGAAPFPATEPLPTGVVPLAATEPPADDFSGVTIRFACSEHNLDEFEAFASEFHEQNPAVRIDVVGLKEVIGDYEGDYALRLVSGVDTAIFPISTHAFSRGMLRDLASFIEADGSFDPDDFYPGMLEAYEWRGGTWALPVYAPLTVLYYEMEVFDEAGVPRPTLDWTRDDFLSAAQALTVRQDGEVVRYGFLGNGGTEAFVLSAAGDLAGDSPQVDTPATADTVRWYTDLMLVHDVSFGRWGDLVTADDEQGGQSVSDLVNGRMTAMWGGVFYKDPDMWVCTYPQIQAGCDGEVGVALFPTEDGPVAPVNWMMTTYIISAGTAHPQENWRWLNFLTRRRLLHKRQENIPATYGYFLPARRSVAEETGYFDQFDEMTRRVIEVAAEHVYIAPPIEARYQLGLAVYDVFDGVPVEEALAEAQVALDQALARAAQATPVPVVVTAPQPEEEGEGIEIAFAPPPLVDQTVYGTLAEAFGAINPDVQVRIVAPDRAESADCFGGGLDLAYESGREGRLNLQSIVDGDAGFPLDDFHPRFLDAARYRGDLWGVPTGARVRVMFYNRDLFDAAGEPYPEPGWTLDDFLARALALTEGSGDEKVYGFVPLAGHEVGLRIFLALQGVELWDPEDEGRPRFDAPDVAAAVRWYADLALAHGAMPIAAEDVTEWGAGWEERRALVREGRAAMWMDYAGVYRDDVWPRDAEVGMASLPLREAGAEGVTSFRYEGLFISTSTANPQACWDWIGFLSDQEELASGLPARVSVLESPEFGARVGEEAVEAYRAMLAYENALDRYPGTPGVRTQMQLLHEAFESILAGADPEAALAEAQARASD